MSFRIDLLSRLRRNTSWLISKWVAVSFAILIGWIVLNLDSGFIASVSAQPFDTTPPTVSILGTPLDWQSTPATASIRCLDEPKGSGCAPNINWRLLEVTSTALCSIDIADYIGPDGLTSPQTVSSHKYFCAVAKDMAGNEGFTLNGVEFKVGTAPLDTIPPRVTVLTLRSRATTDPAVFDWTVTDETQLMVAELWCAPAASFCTDTDKTGCVWALKGSSAASGVQTSGQFTYAPPDDTHYCGAHARDIAGNEGFEPNPPGPLKVVKTSVSSATYTLTVVKNGNGFVTGGGINCGGACQVAKNAGENITLSASPDPGYSFAGWSGCDTSSGTQCNVSMLFNKTVTVTFTQNAPQCNVTTQTGKGEIFQAVSIDPSDQLYYTFAWGDGSARTRVPVGAGTVAQGVPQQASHAYSTTGNFQLTVTATDFFGASATSDPMTICVNQGPPVGTGVGDLSCNNFVDSQDLGILFHFWGRAVADPNVKSACGILLSSLGAFDATVNNDDLSIMFANWGKQTSIVPRCVPGGGCSVGACPGLYICEGSQPVCMKKDPTCGASVPECDDGIDNDGDGKIDFSLTQGAGDPDCGSLFDTTESGVPGTGCLTTESVQVPANNQNGAHSGSVLCTDRRYRLTASGTYQWKANAAGQADAEYYTDTGLPTNPWQQTLNGGLDLMVNGNRIDWLFNGQLAYNPAHVYKYEFTGTGAQAQFKVDDNGYTDNSGILTVLVEDIGGSGGGACNNNGIKEGTEACDGTQLGGAVCPAGTTGTPTCTNCTLGYSSCTTSGGGACNNNGIKEGTEACDGTQLGGAVCPAGTTGTPTCTNCTLGYSSCVSSGGGGSWNHTYPRLAYQHFRDSPPDWNALFDLVVLTRPYAETSNATKAINPNSKFIFTRSITAYGANQKQKRVTDCPDWTDQWYVRRSDGSQALTQGRNQPLLDMTNFAPLNSKGQRYNQHIPRCFDDWYRQVGWDGAGTDWMWIAPDEAAGNIDFNRNGQNDYGESGKGASWVNRVWLEGLQTLLSNWRIDLGANPPLWLNSGKIHDNADIPPANITTFNPPASTSATNFPGVEGISNGLEFERQQGHRSFTSEWRNYQTWINGGRKPTVWITDTYPDAGDQSWSLKRGNNTKNYYELMRMMLAFTMLGDGYFQYNPREGGEHHFYDYYDEFELKRSMPGYPKGLLGDPLGAAVQVSGSPAWARFFQGGVSIENPTSAPITVTSAQLAAVDPSSNKTYYRFRGNQDSGFNNGQAFTSVTLTGHTVGVYSVGDGILLVREPDVSKRTVIADIIVDNVDDFTSPGSTGATFTGGWADPPVRGTNAVLTNWSAWTHDDDTGRATYAFRYLKGSIGNAFYHPTVNVSGQYDVYEWHSDLVKTGIDVDGPTGEKSPGSAETAVRYEVIHAGGTTPFTVNQGINGGRWNRLGTASFNFTGSSNQGVRIIGDGGPNVVQADAIKFVCKFCANTSGSVVAAGADTSFPAISALTITQGSVIADWTATDDKGLLRAELWSAADLNNAPDASTWKKVIEQPASGITASGRLTDATAGTYWFGAHIVDQAGNCVTEAGKSCGGATPQNQTIAGRTPYGPKKMTVAAAATSSMQCGDGQDNDGDGKIDLTDPGCANAGDNAELDPVAGGNGSLTIDLNNVRGPVQKIWQGFGHDPIYQGTLSGRGQAQLAAAKNTTVSGQQVFRWYRAHNLFSNRTEPVADDAAGKVYDPVCDRAKPTCQPPYNWERVDAIFDAIKAHNLKPIVELSFSPSELCRDTPCMDGDFGLAYVSPPSKNNYATWYDLVKATVQHLRVRYGAAETESWRYEVWNEPNHPKFWPVNTDPAIASAQDVTEYNRLYDFSVDAVKSVSQNYKVGGPASAGWSEDFAKLWLEHVHGVGSAANNYKTGGRGAPVDFYALHGYQNIYPTGTRYGIMGNIDGFMKQIVSMDPRWDTRELFLDETGPSSTPVAFHDYPYAAAWYVELIDALYDTADANGAQYLPDLVFWWGQIGKQGIMRQTDATPGSTQGGAIYKRPSFNAHAALQYLNGSRVAVAGATPHDPVHGIASKQGTTQAVLVLYHINEVNATNSAAPSTNVPLSFRGLPFSSFTVTRYAIDVVTTQGQDGLKTVAWPRTSETAVNGTWSTTLSVPENSVQVLILNVL